MKVIHVVTSTNIGGAQIMLLRYLSALGPSVAHHSVISLVGSGPIAKPIQELGVKVSDLGLAPGRVTPAAVLRLRRLLSAARPDIVHGWMYHGCLASWAALVGRRRNRPAQLWAVHHSLADIQREKRATRWVIRALARLSRRADRITYCAQVSRDQHEAVGLCSDRAEVIANAVDTDLFRPNPGARARLEQLCQIPKGRIILGNAARAHPMKDHTGLVRAFARLCAQRHDVHLVLLGEGHQDSPALELAQDLGIADRVSAPGAIGDVETLMPGFDVFVLSSAWGEAFPLAVCEAMACAVPCVVTDVGDCAYLVGTTGVVVPPSDPVALVTAVARVLELDGDQRQVQGRQARARICEKFSTRRYVERHDAAYQKALSWARRSVSTETATSH